MRLKKEQIEKIASVVLKNLKPVMKSRVSEAQIQAKIADVILAYLKAEDDLEAEVYKKMDEFRPQIDAGAMDERKVFMMIKKQLATQKKMVL